MRLRVVYTPAVHAVGPGIIEVGNARCYGLCTFEREFALLWFRMLQKQAT